MASLVTLLEAGTSPWRREWDAAAGGHQVNLLSGRRYCGANPVLLTMGMHLRGSALPYWCGFGEAKALGIFPRKGSKAVHVLRPQLHHHSETELAVAGSAKILSCLTLFAAAGLPSAAALLNQLNRRCHRTLARLQG